MAQRRRFVGLLVGAAVLLGGVAAAPAAHAQSVAVGESGVAAPGIERPAIERPAAAPAARTLSAGKPAISGKALAGQRLTVNPGKWTAGTKLRYQWYANGAPIAKATGTTYAVRPVNVDRRITVRVTGTKAGYSTRSVTSAATSRVIGKKYGVCAALRVDYPDGIRKSNVRGDRERGVLRPFDGRPFVSDALYALQSITRDGDRDGIMCER